MGEKPSRTYFGASPIVLDTILSRSRCYRAFNEMPDVALHCRPTNGKRAP